MDLYARELCSNKTIYWIERILHYPNAPFKARGIEILYSINLDKLFN
jgi:hypothetical protein